MCFGQPLLPPGQMGPSIPRPVDKQGLPLHASTRVPPPPLRSSGNRGGGGSSSGGPSFLGRGGSSTGGPSFLGKVCFVEGGGAGQGFCVGGGGQGGVEGLWWQRLGCRCVWRGGGSFILQVRRGWCRLSPVSE